MKSKNKLLAYILLAAITLNINSGIRAEGEVTDIYSENKESEVISVETYTQPASDYWNADPEDFRPTRNEDNIVDPNPNNSIPLTDLDTQNVIKKLPRVEGGNIKATNILATKPSKARATVTENVDQNAKDVTPKIEENQKQPEEKTDNEIDMRQFMRIKTASGKEFLIVVDHGKDKENVQMLTEVSEQDLLNLIEGQSVEDKMKAEQEAARLQLEQERKEFEENKKAEEERLKQEKNKKPEKTKSGGSSWFTFLLIALVFTGGFVYYKKKKSEDYISDEDSEEDDDYYSDSDDIDYDEYFEEEDDE